MNLGKTNCSIDWVQNAEANHIKIFLSQVQVACNTKELDTKTHGLIPIVILWVQNAGAHQIQIFLSQVQVACITKELDTKTHLLIPIGILMPEWKIQI